MGKLKITLFNALDVTLAFNSKAFMKQALLEQGSFH